ncbi:hypothetical protein BpHYR1_049491 [Brachionus plicatilis]|uniref:Uncharacterized protein n=1 Tax=Brachionus plicatilis TaxID=10195 RepID=A0A3M7S8E2_BRAPC|nr:hypothetical protein BpHYR1_049491 [Brachionus plicatilis]
MDKNMCSNANCRLLDEKSCSLSIGLNVSTSNIVLSTSLTFFLEVFHAFSFLVVLMLMFGLMLMLGLPSVCVERIRNHNISHAKPLLKSSLVTLGSFEKTFRSEPMSLR